MISRSSNHIHIFLGKGLSSPESGRGKKIRWGQNLNQIKIYKKINKDKYSILNVCKIQTMQTRARVLILLPCTGFFFDDLTFNLTHNPNLVLWIILKSTKQNLKTIVGLNSPSMLDSSHLSSFYYFFFLLSNPDQQATGLLLMTTDVFSNTAQQQPAYLSCLPPLYLLAGELKTEICPKHQVFVSLFDQEIVLPLQRVQKVSTFCGLLPWMCMKREKEENVVRIHLPAAVAGRSYSDDGTRFSNSLLPPSHKDYLFIKF